MRGGQGATAGLNTDTRLPCSEVYRLERVDLATVTSETLLAWDRFLHQNPGHAPWHNPQWLRDHPSWARADLRVYLLYDGNELCGVAPFLLKSWPIKWQLGELTIARLPLRRLCLLGGTPLLRESLPAYELLFREMLSAGSQWDALFMDPAPLDSFFWRFVESSGLVRRTLSNYVPDSPAPRMLLQVSGTFDEYMSRFSAKHRKNLRRTVRLLHESAPGEVTWVRFTSPADADEFVEQAVPLSRKTYQWNLLGLGLRSPESLRNYLHFLAGNGCLRSYILYCKGVPAAFVLGFQYASRFYLEDMGYDPAWAEFSVGKVLQLTLIEDLFTHDPPSIYDLGDFGPHKDEFATEQYLQGKIYLFRRGPYRSLARLGHRACRAATAGISVTLARLGVKNKVKKLLRIWSSARGTAKAAQQAAE